MHYDESEEKIERAFKLGLKDFNHVKNGYEPVFNEKRCVAEYELGYEKNLMNLW